jgi:hypothetical protein
MISAMDISAQQALATRMASLLLPTRKRTVSGIVEWFGAMQAQDIASGMWSLGVRLPGKPSAKIHADLEKRDVVRTWPMRGTVHFVPAADARWMLDLMAAKPMRAAGRVRAALGITDAVAKKAIDTLTTALNGQRLTRAECLRALSDAGIDTSGQRGYHLLVYASQAGHTCVAPHIGSEQSFALLGDWAPRQNELDRDEALRTIALRYFRSHGPASRADFAGWTGLTMTEVKHAIGNAGDNLVGVRVAGVEMFADPTGLTISQDNDDVWVLPGFDEYLLGYKDRRLMLADEHKQAIVPGGNGVFQPTVVRAGRVIGTWRRAVGKAKTTVTIMPLVRLSGRDREAVEGAFQPYELFIGQPLDLRWTAVVGQ